jgi:hypothetical protein
VAERRRGGALAGVSSRLFRGDGPRHRLGLAVCDWFGRARNCAPIFIRRPYQYLGWVALFCDRVAWCWPRSGLALIYIAYIYRIFGLQQNMHVQINIPKARSRFNENLIHSDDALLSGRRPEWNTEAVRKPHTALS